MEMNDRTEQAEELWDDLPTDSQHETLWEAEGTELAVRQLMDQLKASEEKQQCLMKKQLLFTRIFAVSNCASCPDLRGGRAAQADDSPG